MVAAMSLLQCSFCGKPDDQVKRLIVGPGVYICNDCVVLCQQILESDHDAERDEPQRTSRSRQSPDARAQILDTDALGCRLRALSDRERWVLERRYGLAGQRPEDLDDIGRTLRLTPEQVRQLERQALDKLRPSPESPA